LTKLEPISTWEVFLRHSVYAESAFCVFFALMSRTMSFRLTCHWLNLHCVASLYKLFFVLVARQYELNKLIFGEYTHVIYSSFMSSYFTSCIVSLCISCIFTTRDFNTGIPQVSCAAFSANPQIPLFLVFMVAFQATFLRKVASDFSNHRLQFWGSFLLSKNGDRGSPHCLCADVTVCARTDSNYELSFYALSLSDDSWKYFYLEIDSTAQWLFRYM